MDKKSIRINFNFNIAKNKNIALCMYENDFNRTLNE